MTEHPIKALGDMLVKARKPRKHTREELLEIARRAFIGQPVTNINALDPNDPHGDQDPFDRDKLQAKKDDELIETNTARSHANWSDK